MIPIQGKIAGPSNKNYIIKLIMILQLTLMEHPIHVDVTNYDPDNLVGRLWWDIGAVRFRFFVPWNH